MTVKVHPRQNPGYAYATNQTTNPPSETAEDEALRQD